jgi:hypothetical protein
MPPIECDAFELKVTLLETDPAVWRRITVPAAWTLAQLHRILQAAVGWQDCHLYEFEIAERAFGPVDEDAPDEVEDATEVTLIDVIRVGHRFFYDYDFGDGWRLEIEVESGATGGPLVTRVACTGGERAGPPEDCGGPEGYAALLEALSDPGHPEHDDLVAWVGEGFDPASFSLVEGNAAVQRVQQ